MSVGFPGRKYRVNDAPRYVRFGSLADLDDLADMLSVIADGGIIISKAIKDKQVLARQMLLYRDFIKAVFLGVPSS